MNMNLTGQSGKMYFGMDIIFKGKKQVNKLNKHKL